MRKSKDMPCRQSASGALIGDQNMPDDALPFLEQPIPPSDHADTAPEPVTPMAPQPPPTRTPPGSPLSNTSYEICHLQVGDPDERGNTVKYIYSRDTGFVQVRSVCP
jgi:hypothetical protein